MQSDVNKSIGKIDCIPAYSVSAFCIQLSGSECVDHGRLCLPHWEDAEELVVSASAHYSASL